MYPGLRDQLVDVYGRIFGLMRADLHPGDRQYATKQTLSEKSDVALNRQLNKQLKNIEASLNSAIDNVGDQLKRAQIQNLEQSLRNNVFDRQILGNQAFSRSVSAAAYNGNGSGCGNP